jgi:group I intron endonuclease
MIEKICGIYCIENIVTLMGYIGKSVNINNRFSCHRSKLRRGIHGNSYLQNAWNKYGEENFKFYILEEASFDEIIKLEIKYIKLYESNNRRFGYNLTEGGEGTKGRKHTEEEKRKVSEFMRQRPVTERMRENMRGKVLSEEHKIKMAEGRENYIMPTELSEKFRENKVFKKRRDINPSSRFLGVSIMPNGDWNVSIYVDKKQISLGGFISEADAALAYNDVVKKYYPERDIVNIINDEDIKKSEEEKRLKEEKRLSNKSSKYFGVHWCNDRNSWISRYYHEGKTKYIGSFDLEIEAAIAYNEIVAEVFGYKAKLNNISQEEIKNLWNMI